VDPNQLELALLNLAVNARDAMPGGGMLTITAAGEQVEDAQHPAAIAPGDYVRLSVIDTGSGMDAATVKRAIEPFFSTKTDGRGTGLGLSMVHGLAAQSGGGLMIASQPGLGTRIEMWLPVGGEADGAEEAETPMPASVRPLSILLVDDEDLVRAAPADMLSEAGHRVDQAQNGAAALHMFGDKDYDLLVTDFAMPGMSGAELVAKLRERAPGLGALLITGYASAADLPSNLPRLNKPFRSADLLGRIESIASEHKVIRFPKEAKA
jgi:CheY-like chemotaxis protein